MSRVSISHWGRVDAGEPTVDDDLAYLDVPFKAYSALTEAGFTRTWQIEALPRSTLEALKGIGPDASRQIRGALRGRAIDRLASTRAA